MEDNELRDVFISQNVSEAMMVLDILKSSGLDAVILDAYACGSVGGFGPAVPARVAVPERQEKAALELMAEMQK